MTSNRNNSKTVFIFDKNLIFIDKCESFKATANKYDISVNSLRKSFINSNKLIKNRYYFYSLEFLINNNKDIIEKFLLSPSNLIRFSPFINKPQIDINQTIKTQHYT